MKKKTFFIPIIITVITAVIFFVLIFFNFFQKLDYRVYDSLVHLKKETEVSDKITLINADDPSIEALGEWPWSRDIMGDVLIRLKEFKAQFAVFDIEYISPSKNSIAPSAEQKLTEQIYKVQDDLNSNISTIPDAVGINLRELTDALIDVNNDEFNNLIDYVNSNISRDNDEYFAQAIQYFGNTWLTVNHSNLGYKTSDEDLEYIDERFLLKNVMDPYSQISVDNYENSEASYEEMGFTPAMHKLLTRANGVSFTNSFIDSDGTRRRMELLYEYNDSYLPQLVFGPFLKTYKVKSIIKEDYRLILRDAVIPETGEMKDIIIPLDNQGRVMINYSHKSIYESFNNISIIALLNLDRLEKDFQALLTNICIDKKIYDENYDLLPYLYDAYYLLQNFESLTEMKSSLLAKCQGFDEKNNPISAFTDEEFAYYTSLRNDYFASLGDFINQKYLDKILSRIEEMQTQGIWDGTEEDIQYFMEDFGQLESAFNTYNTIYDELKTKLKDSYCIVGQTATSTTDMGATPFFKKFENVGIHANLLNTLITENFIKYVEFFWGFGISVLLFLLVLLFGKKSNTFQNIVDAVLLVLIIITFVVLFVVFDIYIPFIGTVIFLIINYALIIGYRFAVSNKEKKLITAIASSFANKDTVEELRKNPEAFQTKGEKKQITALFSDVQKFSTLSEQIGKIYGDEGPNKLIEILNEYLGQMSNEILINNGTIDKYEGDAIISMFGAPDPLNSKTPNEWAYLCLDSAIRMKKVEEVFNREHEDLFKPQTIINPMGIKETVQLSPLQTRIGINSGDAYVGLMGSKTENFSKLNYTMIGDTVNLASRLEGVNKAYKTWIMCSGDTWNMANSGENKDKIIARRLDLVRVVGKNVPVPIYNILGFKDEFTYLQVEQLDMFNAAMEEYYNKNFVKAGQLFIQASTVNGLNDPTCLIYAERCKNLLEKGIPEDWDFVIKMTSK